MKWKNLDSVLHLIFYTGNSYYKAIGALSDSNTTNYILSKHPAIYLYGSLYHAANFLGGIDQTQLGQWLQMYSTALEDAKIMKS